MVGALVVIEERGEGETQWLLSFDGPNPAPESVVRCVGPEEAFKLKALIVGLALDGAKAAVPATCTCGYTCTMLDGRAPPPCPVHAAPVPFAGVVVMRPGADICERCGRTLLEGSHGAGVCDTSAPPPKWFGRKTIDASAGDWPPDSSRTSAFGHHPGCAPPKEAKEAGDVTAWGCVPGCPALEKSPGGAAP